MTGKEKLKEIKELADAMYYAAQYLTTDASRLHKTMEDYHQFIIHEYFKEEPVSNDFEMALAEMIDKAQTSVVEPLVIAAQWKDELIKLAKSEEPVSENLEEACEQLAENARKHKAETSSPFFSPTDYRQGVIDGSQWQKEQLLKDAKDGILENDDFYGYVKLTGSRVGYEQLNKEVKVIILMED